MQWATNSPGEPGGDSPRPKDQQQPDVTSKYTTKLLAALALTRTRDFRVFPLVPDRKMPLIAKEDGGNGCLDATADEAQIRAWWKKYPRANIGIGTGDGLVLIDQDTYKGAGISNWNLPPTLTARTARGGLHAYFHYDDVLPCVNEGILAPGVCIKAAGGLAVAPPSTFEHLRGQAVHLD